jgi:hypothetical protein
MKAVHRRKSDPPPPLLRRGRRDLSAVSMGGSVRGGVLRAFWQIMSYISLSSYVRSKGSHLQLKKGNLLVTVPMHNKDLKIETLKSILRQSKMSIDEIMDLL